MYILSYVSILLYVKCVCKIKYVLTISSEEINVYVYRSAVNKYCKIWLLLYLINIIVPFHICVDALRLRCPIHNCKVSNARVQIGVFLHVNLSLQRFPKHCQS